jgi:HK97 family phage portal protein
VNIFGLSITRNVKATSDPPSNRQWQVYHPIINSSGVPVSIISSQQLATVYACVKVLAETVSSVPLITYRRLPDGGKERATDHWAYNLLKNEPNSKQTSLEWRKQEQGHLALDGNAFSEIIWDRTGSIAEELIPIEPDRVVIEERGDDFVYRITERDGKNRFIFPDSMLHTKGETRDGIVGLSPIETAAETIGLSLAAQKFGASFYGNGANAGSVYEHPEPLSDTALAHLRESIERNYGSGPANGHRTVILEEGMTWKPLGLSPSESQAIETRSFQVEDVARLWRMPPHMIGHLERSTNNNIEHQSIEFVKYTMMPWFKMWEQAINRALLGNSEEYFVEFLVDALLRGEQVKRHESYRIAVSTGYMSRNEVRERENMNKADDLDEFLLPVNVATAEDVQSGEFRNSGNGGLGGDNDKEQEKEAIDHRVLVEDASARLYAAERREVEKKAGKNGFEDWAAKFAVKQQSMITKTLLPLAKAFGGQLDAGRIEEHMRPSRFGAEGREKEYLELCYSVAEHLERDQLSVVGDSAGEDGSDSSSAEHARASD